jgi:hypothetical protein
VRKNAKCKIAEKALVRDGVATTQQNLIRATCRRTKDEKKEKKG